MLYFTANIVLKHYKLFKIGKTVFIKAPFNSLKCLIPPIPHVYILRAKRVCVFAMITHAEGVVGEQQTMEKENIHYIRD